MRLMRELRRAHADRYQLYGVVPSLDSSRRGPPEMARVLGGPHDPADRSAPPYVRLPRCRVRRRSDPPPSAILEPRVRHRLLGLGRRRSVGRGSPLGTSGRAR
jgi:hypothetical protein